MKLNKLSVVTASVLLSTSVMAQALVEREFIKPVKKVSKYTAQKVDFGSYKVERNLIYIPKSVASTENIVSTKGIMAIVRTDSPVQLVSKGTLVRNTFTDVVSPLSGNISLLLKQGVSVQQVSDETGLSVVSAYAGTNLAVVKVKEGQDLIEASKQLKASGLVKVAKIEVLEILHKAY
ncbi:hypothetical protein CJF42_14945 [Pseudoalteromonas sp. NBT06-2]|uniref:hypothetical protein n=1 Tax=Pseudoalteromonas sp. NBT06-2 TaxID=2025950 RepID=UPI000BA7C1E3|nr:hypothetical protein [Pseudoalteromonas sp. NBT06-2]PAJ73602.1 hypothetical protein CJF42_14945 [Pseudoalteromonas sp. NBT06-2]